MAINFGRQKRIFGIRQDHFILLIIGIWLIGVIGGFDNTILAMPLKSVISRIPAMSTFSTVSIGGSTCDLATPLAGTIGCWVFEPNHIQIYTLKEGNINTYIDEKYIDWEGSDECPGDDKNTDQCEYVFYVDNDNEKCKAFWVRYRICTDNDCGDWNIYKDGNWNWFWGMLPYEKQSFLYTQREYPMATLGSGQRIEVKAVQFESELFGVIQQCTDSDPGFRIKAKYDAYGLRYYSATSGFHWIEGQSCSLDLIDKDKLPEDYDRSKISANSIKFDNEINFVVAWVPDVYSHEVVTWNGQTAYCEGDGHVKSFTMKTMANGKCYAFPDVEIGKEVCCPNPTSVGSMYCGTDFKMHPLAETQFAPECLTAENCAKGVWVPHPTDTYLKVKYKCENGRCVQDKVETAECTYNNQCSSGICEDFKCKEAFGGEYAMCGNGKCEGKEEQLCPQDCGGLPKWLDELSKNFNLGGIFGLPFWLIIIIGLVLLFLFMPLVTAITTTIGKITGAWLESRPKVYHGLVRESYTRKKRKRKPKTTVEPEGDKKK